MNDVALVLGFWFVYCLAIYIFVVRRKKNESNT